MVNAVERGKNNSKFGLQQVIVASLEQTTNAAPACGSE